MKRNGRVHPGPGNGHLASLLIGAILLLFAAPPAFAERPGALIPSIRRIMAEAVSKGFHGAVLVGRGDEVLFESGYGIANPDWRQPNGADTRFAIASVTKTFTAVAVMQLAEQDRLRLDSPVCDYLDDCPAAWRSITIEHLLTHRSGIPEYFSGHLTRNHLLPYSPQEIRALFEAQPLDFPPGTAFHYSNSGYFLLGQIIERASGQSYGAYLVDHIFAPAGMHDSGMNDWSQVVDRRAVGLEIAAGGTIRLQRPSDLSWAYSAAGLYSTVGDLFRFVRALAGHRLISRAALARMWSGGAERYGLGWWTSGGQSPPYLLATGGIVGFQSSITYYPDRDATLVVLCNAPGLACARAGTSLRALAADSTIERNRP